ncbi:MAG: hypothetical protein EP299_01905, partial [Acidobacteria bacterium]
MTQIGKLSALTVLLILLAPGICGAGCPPAEKILEYLAGIDLRLASRTTRFSLEPPEQLYAKAAADPGKAVTERRGLQAAGVMVAEVPVETLWMAINDEDHHAEGDYLPIRYSQVIGGANRGQSRLLFQYFRKLGVGRWWVDRMDMDGELFRRTEAKLWELRWQDEMDSYDRSPPPEISIDPKVPPIRETRGAWLLVPIGAGCTLIEYSIWSDPGGLLSKAQLLMARSVVRDTLEGMTR